MIFGFGKKKKAQEEGEERQVELVLFKGALNGKEANLQANAKLAKAGLLPSKQIITDGLSRRAEMIRIEPKGPQAAVTFLVDGVPYPGPRLPKPQAFAVTQMIKLLSGLEVQVRDKPQSGGVRVELEERPYELRVDTQPVQAGERLIIRVRNPREERKSPEELGMTDELKQKIRSLTSGRQGLFLVCGPPFSGTTTTAYTVLRSLDAFLYGIFTLGDTEGRELINIGEAEWNPGETLRDALVRLVRAEADVAFLADPVNKETLDTILRMQEDISIIGEFPAKDAAHGIVQLIEWAGDAGLVSRGVRGVMSQKLVRKLCPECREAYKPNPKILAKVGLPSETKVLYRKPKPPTPEEKESGDYWPCDVCGDIGFLGRIAIFELIEMTDAMKELVASSPTPQAIKELARKEQMWSFQKDGLRLVAEGVTSLEELQRVFKAG
ncbi:MAG: Flp pilus assembly complex ATPase component [Planctomycetes bacterium]|nr:Flp pilus assembly complex ATPase component [Planctomycetota bacterium]